MLTLILGPMKSGKSLEIVRRFGHLPYSTTRFALYQPRRNVRDDQVSSRSGASLAASKITRLREILPTEAHVVGIDEVHMFRPTEVAAVRQLLNKGISVVAAGCDMDYRGRLFTTVRRLLELGPTEVVYRQAVCERCRTPHAVYTQIVHHGEPVLRGLPAVVPEDGTYHYQPMCRRCFIKDRR